MLAAILKPFAGIFGAAVVVLLVLGGPAVWYWDRRPPHTPAFHVLFLHWSAPDSLKARLDAQAGDLRQAIANERTLTSALNAQNASLAAWSARGRRQTAEAENAVQRGQGAMAGAERARAVISAPLPAADDACARARVVDARLLGALR